ncbi:MAG TPA: TonB-dependent receptor, partial [Steroidobacteraceae bacterium]|nr:TonB-dependent receptor [Steroidobacteraceae bacterium]
MKIAPFAGLVGLAALGAHAQSFPSTLPRYFEPVVVTATRGIYEAPSTLRDAVVITRDEIEASPGLTLAEVLQRHAGAEFRATGGPGQPTGIFLRGAGAAQTLVLIDGLRAGSASAGTTAVEAIPLEMIERIEVVKGPMSSLYGSEAIGGVVQVFTRGKGVPHLFATGAYGTDNDRRASAGIATAEGGTKMALSFGARKVEARSATNERVPFGVHDPDRDPHENGFANVRISQKVWTGETLALEAFGSRSKTLFDGGNPADRSDQAVSGARISSNTDFTSWWASRLTLGHGRDRLRLLGPFPALFETRQDQVSWINDFRTSSGSLLAGAEILRQKVLPDSPETGAPPFARSERETRSVFAAVNESLQGQRFEASIRRDDDEQFGVRNTGSVSAGSQLTRDIRLAITVAHGFRAPTFNDLYLTAYEPFYTPNPDLRPERSRSREVALRSSAPGALQWRITAFDNQLDDLIVATAATVMNVDRARVRGVEAAADLAWLGIRWRAAVTLQRPRNE